MPECCRKYEEICAPQVEEFCYITDNTYLKDEVCVSTEFDKWKQIFSNKKTDLFSFGSAGSRHGIRCSELPEVWNDSPNNQMLSKVSKITKQILDFLSHTIVLTHWILKNLIFRRFVRAAHGVHEVINSL